MDYVSTITTKGQVTIPADVRKALGLKARDRVAFRLEDQAVRVERASSSIVAGYGSVKLRRPLKEPKRLRREAERWVAQQALRET
ncbi:MAG: type II toxin-antitoxin system PrlF family antitoxin [Chloroflexi bacterium]|nr:type II toxin-antitoxin system PrlF family antitoxin [Chloroflexota bacterium]